MISDTKDKEHSEQGEYFEEEKINRVNKRGNKNEKKEEGSGDGNNTEEEKELDTTECSPNDSYDEQFMFKWKQQRRGRGSRIQSSTSSKR